MHSTNRQLVEMKLAGHISDFCDARRWVTGWEFWVRIPGCWQGLTAEGVAEMHANVFNGARVA